MWQVPGPVRLPGPARRRLWLWLAEPGGSQASASPPTEPGSGTAGGGARVFGPTVGPSGRWVSSYVVGWVRVCPGAGSGAVVSGLDLAELTKETEVPRWYCLLGAVRMDSRAVG